MEELAKYLRSLSEEDRKKVIDYIDDRWGSTDANQTPSLMKE